MATLIRRSYQGGARALKLKAPITSTATSFDGTGNFATWPTGATGRFVITVDEGLPTEEKMTVSTFSHSTGQFTIHTRGFDGTAAVGHVPQSGTNASQIRLTWSATEATQANLAVVETVGKITAKGDLLVGTGSQAMARLAIGTTGQVPAVNTSGTLHYISPSAAFGVNTTAAKIKPLGSAAAAGSTTLAAAATHVHLGLAVGHTNVLHGTVSGSAFYMQVASKTVITTGSGLAKVTLPQAFPNALIAAWVMTWTAGDHAGYLITIDKTTCTNQRVAVALTFRTGSSPTTFTVHMMVLAVGC